MLDPHQLQTDSYDREACARALAAVEGCQELLERGGRLVPHFPALLDDLFAALFKLSLRLRPGEGPASALLGRQILLAAMRSPGFADLKDETALDSARSAHAACALAGRALALIKTGDLFLEEELLGAQQLAEEEERLDRLRAAADELGDEAGKLRAQLERALAQAEKKVEQLARQMKQSISEVPPRFEAEIASTASRLAEDLPRYDESADSFARAVGGSGPRSAGERLKLAEKLEKSDKLKQLARLAGALRAEARAARRKSRERAATEVYRVGRGSQLSRLLPSELSALRHPLRRRDFLRRLLEEEISQYELRGDDRHGRGPVVVCLDGSGSMSGARELWAKAVALALLEIARKQGRRTRAIVFSGAESDLSSFDLTGKLKRVGCRPVDLEQVVKLAECFPGGGTDFEKPLRAALQAVGESSLRGADIVFITDGEAKVSEQFAEELRREKKKRDIGLFAVLVDDPSRNVARGDRGTGRAAQELGKIADELTTVTELTAASARALFRAL